MCMLVSDHRYIYTQIQYSCRRPIVAWRVVLWRRAWNHPLAPGLPHLDFGKREIERKRRKRREGRGERVKGKCDTCGLNRSLISVGFWISSIYLSQYIYFLVEFKRALFLRHYTPTTTTTMGGFATLFSIQYFFIIHKIFERSHVMATVTPTALHRSKATFHMFNFYNQQFSRYCCYDSNHSK